MSDKKKTTNYRGWPGGLFSNGPAKNAQQNQLLQADNCVIDEFGAVTQRKGITSLLCSSAAEIIDFLMINDPADSFVLDYKYLSNKNLTYSKVYRINAAESPDVVIHTYASSNVDRGKFLFFNNGYSHTNGIDNMQAWVPRAYPGAGVTADALGAPKTVVLHSHNGRVFCANGETLYETVPGTGPSSSVDNFATGATWAIKSDKTKKITAVGSIGRDLYIFKSDEIWIQVGYTVSERTTRLMFQNIGTLSPRSLQTVVLPGIGEALIFFSTNQRLCAIANGNVFEIGEAVRDILDSVSPAYDYFLGQYTPDIKTSSIDGNGNYYLGINGTSCLVMNYSFSVNGRFPFTLWSKGSGFVTFSAMHHYQGMDPAALAFFGNNLVLALISPLTLFGSSYTLGMLANRFCVASIYEFPSVTKDTAANGVLYPITMTIKTVHENVGTEQEYKNFSDAVIKTSFPDVSGTKTMTVTQVNDQDSTIGSETLTQVATTVNKIYDYPINLGNDAKECSLTIATSTIQKIHGIELQSTKGANI